MNKTNIPYVVWSCNPWHSCAKLSAGCKNCYAETLSHRMGLTKLPWTHANLQENLRDQRHQLVALRRTLSRTPPDPDVFDVFLCDMTDPFLEEVPEEWRHELFDAIEAFPDHRFMMFTKRLLQAQEWTRWPANLMLVVSVEDYTVRMRIDVLRQTGAALKGVSFEPLLGPVETCDVCRDKGGYTNPISLIQMRWFQACVRCRGEGEYPLDLSGLDWVVVGAESGRERRPFDMAWARTIRDRAVETGVPFWFKQASGLRPGTDPFLVEEDGTQTTWNQLPG